MKKQILENIMYTECDSKNKMMKQQWKLFLTFIWQIISNPEKNNFIYSFTISRSGLSKYVFF